MKAFAALFTHLDQATKTSDKVAAMRLYFQDVDLADGAWAVHFLAGGKLSRIVPTKVLRSQAAIVAGIDDWLFDECYDFVGDLAETISRVLPAATASSDDSLAHWIHERIEPLRTLEEPAQRVQLTNLWQGLSHAELLVVNKLMTGSLRLGVSRRLVIQALAQLTGLSTDVIAHRLTGTWKATAENYGRLIAPDAGEASLSQPYPFFLANPIEDSPSNLGPIDQWHVEWKWDGIRAQLISRDGQLSLWSRGEEMLTDRFPEIVSTAALLPSGTVIDGEILAWNDQGVMSFQELQRRIGRKTVGKRLLSEVPAVLMAFDLLEDEGHDIRVRPLIARRQRLGEIVTTVREKMIDARLQLSPLLEQPTWEDLARLRETSREVRAEGLMLKQRSSPYRVGRPRGDWWKWKVTPYTIDAVLIYAQRGHGRRAGLYTDYTFAVWNDARELVPFAKAYSGLTDAEIRRVDAFVRDNTIDRFGPVRSVTPALVFELAFENIQRSSRHKSGVAVRFPRIVRWRTDLTIDSADSLSQILAMMDGI